MFTFEQIEERKGNMQQKELPKISRNFTSVTEELQKCISWIDCMIPKMPLSENFSIFILAHPESTPRVTIGLIV